jgi:hypothetical protein
LLSSSAFVIAPLILTFIIFTSNHASRFEFFSSLLSHFFPFWFKFSYFITDFCLCYLKFIILWNNIEFCFETSYHSLGKIIEFENSTLFSNPKQRFTNR